jgi:hypothetical protein
VAPRCPFGEEESIPLLLAGERVISGSTALVGTVIFGTTTPATTATNTCNALLGEARIYMMSYTDATSIFDVNRFNALTALDRVEIRAGDYSSRTRFSFQSKSMGKAIRQLFLAPRPLRRSRNIESPVSHLLAAEHRLRFADCQNHPAPRILARNKNILSRSVAEHRYRDTIIVQQQVQRMLATDDAHWQ